MDIDHFREDSVSMKKDYWLYGVAVVVGITYGLSCPRFPTGERRGIPSGISRSAFRWSVLCRLSWALLCRTGRGDGGVPFAGQLVWILLAQGPGNLLPLGVIVFGSWQSHPC